MSILVILVSNTVWFLHSGLELGTVQLRYQSGESQEKQFFHGQGKVRENLRCLLKSVKSQGIIFSCRKVLFKMINFNTLRVTCAGTVFLAADFAPFILFANLIQGQ